MIAPTPPPPIIFVEGRFQITSKILSSPSSSTTITTLLIVSFATEMNMNISKIKRSTETTYVTILVT
ncbi:hypothetical protein DERF_001098 [Dermatophagoides farinae]|uniref:Uncharacterized protein n=1 Tax=Dermatophagoides farinae TaxID=6954 RepID=A0A922L8C6_DERFA|nr:hypothetical protein DERF_001098 [Dermatophagoides farinae]